VGLSLRHGLQQQLFSELDNDAPRELNILLLGAGRADGKPKKVDSLAVCWYQIDPSVVVDLVQQLFVQLVATLTTHVYKAAISLNSKGAVCS